MNILRCFSLLSGMSINIQKSHLLGVGVPEVNVVEAAKSIGCSTMKTPFKYLGILVGDNMSSIKAWDDTVAKMENRLSRWKLKTLSIGGRITLLKSVLGSTPVYNMSIFKVPKLVLNKLESLPLHGLNGQSLSAAFRSPWSTIIKEVSSLKDKGVDLISHVKIRVGKGALESVTLSNMDDRWIWDLNGDGSFQVKGVRAMLDEAFLPKMDSPTRNSYMSILLLQGEHNVDFHPIVDFVEASPLRMSQFGPITHTHTYVVPFHTQKLFTTLRANNPSFSGRIVPLFDTMLVPQGEGSGTPTEPHHTPSPKAQQTSSTTPSSPTLPSITIVPIPTNTPSDTPTLRQYTRRARIAQSSALSPVADKPASPLRDVREGEACPTDSGFQADQDRANIAKTSTLPHDSAPRVTPLATDEGSMQLKLDELTGLCTSLQRQHSKMVAKFEAQELEINKLKARVKLLKDREGVAAERSRDEAPLKRRNLDEGKAVAERVPTGSGSIPTAGPPVAEVPTGSDVIPTAGLIFATATVVTPYTRRKGKETMVESETPKKKIQEHMDIQMARQLEEDMERDS
nr:RNA-directed DNA polymerase, eukaryota [Tanacetum cinerariifolium]